MNSIKLKSRAKVNLSIDVLGKRQDGYHLVEMIMQTIDLYDLIEIKEKEENQCRSCISRVKQTLEFKFK